MLVTQELLQWSLRVEFHLVDECKIAHTGVFISDFCVVFLVALVARNRVSFVEILVLTCPYLFLFIGWLHFDATSKVLEHIVLLDFFFPSGGVVINMTLSFLNGIHTLHLTDGK